MQKPIEKVGVFIRIKPTDKFAEDLLDISEDSETLTIHAREDKKAGYINNQILEWKFKVDRVLHNDCQETVFKRCASRLVYHTLDGYNSTLFAYGQTGAGKTYTMTGTTNDFQHRGIIPRVLSQLYKEIAKRHEYDFKVRISYLEIYREELFDLLCTVTDAQRTHLTLSENDRGEIFVKGLSRQIADSEEEALSLLFEGESNRVIGHHQLNRHSSRSHCVFTIHVESHCITDTQINYTSSKFHLVDLAGSERIGKTKSHGETHNEALYINKSLSFLEQAVIALETKSRYYVPYRQSKLTHMLKDSIGGRCATVMIGNVWGEEKHLEETLSTLRFASRAMNIACEPCVNTFINTELLCKQYEKEISLLKKELAMYDTLTSRGQINYEPLSELQLQEIQMQVQRYIDSEIEEIDFANIREMQEAFRQFKLLYKKKGDFPKKSIAEKVETVDKTLNVEKTANEFSPAIPDRSNLVGETEATGFSVGRTNQNIKPAPSSAVANIRKKNKKAKETSDSSDKNAKSNLTSSTVMPILSNSMQMDEKSLQSDVIGSSSNADTSSLKRPLSKSDAFELFKSDFAKDLSVAFQENKEILRQKKCEAKSLSKSLSKMKKTMDEIKLKLEPYQLAKESSADTDDSNEIFEQKEFELIQSLRMLKNEYRINRELLQSLDSDIIYCEKLVKQCRHTLMVEFEEWFYKNYGALSNVKAESLEQKFDEPPKKQDAGEMFSSKQKELLLKHPESYAFYNARFTVNRRRWYNGYDKKRMEPILPKLALPHFSTSLSL